MSPHYFAARALLVCALLYPALAPCADLLDTPAAPSALAQHALINGLAHAGSRVVAVGQRGHILYSDNQGGNWSQAKVPLSTDLTAVFFPTPRDGWAVGHDGVILHSTDAGATWAVQLDQRKIDKALGADPSFLDVWFRDAQNGFAVGAFNLIMATTDGGRSWTSWSKQTDNPDGYHLNAIRALGEDVYIAGEHGVLLRLAADGSRFEALKSPYQGSFFGITGQPGALIAHGLRGNAWRSADRGASWQRIDTGINTGLTASAAGGAGIVLLSQAGQVLLSTDAGLHFAPVKHKPGPVSAALLSGGQLVVGGARGLRALPLAPQ
ncbi:MAG: YCF48-related protein [Pseudomonadota bacterium]